MDNFAWVLLHELDNETVTTIQPNKVNLYCEQVQALIPEGPTKAKMNSFSPWHNEVSRLRHPVAHRVPLQVLGRVISADESEEYKALEAEYNENIELYFKDTMLELRTNPSDLNTEAMSEHNRRSSERKKAFENKQQQLKEAEQLLGKFWPYFLSVEDDTKYPIYPTTTHDINTLNQVTETCLSFLHQQKNS